MTANVEPASAAQPTANSNIRFLPQSGIGVDAPWLMIAPAGNPTIRLDARLLDRVDLIRRSPAAPLVATGLAIVGGIAAGISALPGGIFASAGLAYLAHDRFGEARRRMRSRDLLLGLGSLEVALHIADGPQAAKQIAEQLTPYTRNAAITRPEVYEDAKFRIRAATEGASAAAARRELEQALLVGSDSVFVRGDILHVGVASFHVADVRDHARRGANLTLAGGRLLQAAMGLLVVAADERIRAGEDLTLLAKRIADYEAWSGRFAGR